MSPELVAPLVIAALALVVVVSTQWLGPWRARRRVAALLARCGWTAVPPSSEAAWDDVMRLAVEGNRGPVRKLVRDERHGPFTEHYERTETRSGWAGTVFRDGGSARPRYVGIGVKRTEVDARSRGFPAASRRRTGGTRREVWIGEAVRGPAEEPALVFSAVAESFGDAARRLAARRGVDPGSIAELPSPGQAPPGEAMHRVARSSAVAHEALAEVYVGPQAWVMTVPLARAPARLDRLLALAEDISATLTG